MENNLVVGHQEFNSKSAPDVSVCVMTYNQKKYIRKCLESIIDQQGDFDFELIVGDDCSTDGTTEIVKELALRYPGKIRLIDHKKNLGPAKNYLSVYSEAKGKYVAHCDGDDVWLPGKLSQQIKILDDNPSFSAVFSNGFFNEKKLNEEKDFFFNSIEMPLQRIFTSSKFIHSSFVTRCYDIDLIKEYINRFGDIFDFEIYWLLLRGGGVFVSKKPLVIYTNNADGISKRTGILDKYSKSFKRLKEFGMSDDLVNELVKDHRLIKSIATGAGDVSLFEYASRYKFEGDIFLKLLVRDIRNFFFIKK